MWVGLPVTPTVLSVTERNLILQVYPTPGFQHIQTSHRSCITLLMTPLSYQMLPQATQLHYLAVVVDWLGIALCFWSCQGLKLHVFTKYVHIRL